MILTVLCTGLAEAVLKDEQGDGLDISAGMFGEHTSAWLRDIAGQLSMYQTTVTLRIKHDKPIPNLVDLVAGRSYTIDGVTDVSTK